MISKETRIGYIFCRDKNCMLLELLISFYSIFQYTVDSEIEFLLNYLKNYTSSRKVCRKFHLGIWVQDYKKGYTAFQPYNLCLLNPIIAVYFIKLGGAYNPPMGLQKPQDIIYSAFENLLSEIQICKTKCRSVSKFKRNFTKPMYILIETNN